MAYYNHYQGNSGVVRRVDEFKPRAPMPGPTARAQPSHEERSIPPRPVSAPPSASRRPPSPLSGLSGELGKLLGKLSHMELETDDLLLLLILYLMYKESKDEELLFIIGAMLFL